MQRSQFRVLKTIGTVVVAAAIAPTLAAAQSQSDTTASAKAAVTVTDTIKAGDTVKVVKGTSGTQVIQLTPQGGSAKPGQGMVIQMQGPNGQKMSGVLQIQMGGSGGVQGGQAPAGGQPQIKTDAAADTTGKAPAADSTKAAADSAKAPSR